MPYLNQYDAAATDFADMFTDKPDFTPYKALAVDPSIFDPQKALTPLDEHFDWEAVRQTPLIDDVKDMQDDRRTNEATATPGRRRSRPR
jgi:hypothetical protein